jgi:hypothetical protein
MQKWKGPPGEGRADPKHVQAASVNNSDYKPSRRRRQHLYRERPAVAALVLQSLIRCGGTVRP